MIAAIGIAVIVLPLCALIVIGAAGLALHSNRRDARKRLTLIHGERCYCMACHHDKLRKASNDSSI